MAKQGELFRRASFHWTYDTLTPTLGKFTVTANVAIAERAKKLAEDIADWMKENRQWEDRSGDARAGLNAEAVSSGFKQEIYLFHGVEYGIWLEIRWDQQYAIIIPALDHFSHTGMGAFNGVLDETNFVSGISPSRRSFEAPTF